MAASNNDNIEIDLPNELFMANAVHEIRTPVQTVIGTLDLLSDTHLNPEQMEYVRQIRYGADVLLALVNDILDFSKIKSHKMTLETVPFDIKVLAENVVHLISIEAYNKGLEIVTDIDYNIPDKVIGDPTRIQQILLNLLKNAVKFTNQGYIHLELSKKDDELLFQITDSGIGISKQKQKNLFESFVQGDSSYTRKYGGTGLGLAICRGLVSRMNGKIGVRPNPYGGSCFWFTLPFLSEQKYSQKSYVLPVPATTRILIVDDSKLATNSLVRQLNSIGLQYIQCSTNSDDALLKMEYAAKLGNPFDMVFIDMIMPVADGWYLASEIKNNDAICNAKLYMLVPEGQMGISAKMKLMDWCAGYVYKPVRRDKLDALLLDTNGDIPSIRLIEEVQSPEELKKADLIEAEKDSHLAENITVLICEDHPVNRQILVQFVKKFGAKILEASNGKEALELVENHPEIQIIFMDIQMPVMSGTEATKALRKNSYHGIIIACTANNDPKNFTEYQEDGMNDILVKPFKREKVKKMLDKWKMVINLPNSKPISVIDDSKVTKDDLWDIQDFEDTIGQDWDLGNQIILDYIDQTRHFIITCKNILENKDFEELHRIAHTLKGSSAAISANKLTNISSELSQATKDKDASAFLLHLLEFEEQFNMFILQSNKWDHKC